MTIYIVRMIIFTIKLSLIKSLIAMKKLKNKLETKTKSLLIFLGIINSSS